jgi:rhodanese-related sulfurtransferase
MPDISAAEALRLAQGGARLVDVREADEWMRGHSPLAVHLPMSQLQARVTELPDDEQLLVVCHSGGRSQRVTEALNGAGYDAVNVAGGMLAWKSAGGEIVAEGTQAPSVD